MNNLSLKGLGDASRMFSDDTNRISPLVALSAFVAGLGIYVHFRIGVRVSLTELILPLLFLLNIRHLKMVRWSTGLKFVIWSTVLYVSLVFASDYFNEVPFRDSMKGIAVPLLMRAHLAVYLLLFSHSVKSLAYFVAGVFIGTILQAFFNLATEYEVNSDVYAYAFFVYRLAPLTIALSAVAGYFVSKSWPLGSVFVYVVTAVVMLLAGSRAYVFVCGVCAIIILFFFVLRSSSPWMESNPMKAGVLFFVVISFALFAGGRVYGVLLQTELFETIGMRKSIKSDETLLTQIFQSRSDVLGSIYMIFDKPLLGHGSASYRHHYFLAAARDVGLRSAEYTGYNSSSNAGHSIFFASLSNAGVFVAAYWITSALIVMNMVSLMLARREKIVILVLPFAFWYAWDFVFSPLSVQMRATIPFLESLAICFLASRKL